MRELIWIVIGLAAAVWSGFAWIACTLIGLGGEAAVNGVGRLPLTPGLAETLSWLATTGSGAEEWLVVAVWIITTAMIAALGLVIDSSLPRRMRPA